MCDDVVVTITWRFGNSDAPDVIGGMTQDHESVAAIDEIGPFGSQVLLPVDLGARRPR